MGDSLGCLKVDLRGFLCSGFSTGYSGFCHCCTGAKAFVWLDRMLHHRADPTNAMIGGDNSQTRSPWGVQVKQLTKICWHLICSPIHPRLLGRGRFKPCFEPGYFLLQLSNCMMETCMLLAGVRVHEHW